MPESVAIEVLEETSDKAYLVIPSNRMAIADDDLDLAGGSGPPRHHPSSIYAGDSE